MVSNYSQCVQTCKRLSHNRIILFNFRTGQQVGQGTGSAHVQSFGKPTTSHRRLYQTVEEWSPILVAREHGFTPVAAIQDVKVRAGMFDLEFSGHAAEVALRLTQPDWSA